MLGKCGCLALPLFTSLSFSSENCHTKTSREKKAGAELVIDMMSSPINYSFQGENSKEEEFLPQ
jgi:hypothetical protein